MAATVEDSPGVDDHAGRVNFSGDDALGLDFYAAFCEDHAVKSASDDYVIPFDLAFNFGALTEDHGLFGNNVAFNVAVDTERAFDLQRPFHGDALINESGPIFACAVF